MRVDSISTAKHKYTLDEIYCPNFDNAIICLSDNTNVYNVDAFTTPFKINTPAKHMLFKLSDGNTYDLKEVLKNQIFDLISSISEQQKNENWFTKIKSKIFEFMKIETQIEKIQNECSDTLKYIENSDNAKTLFESVTGKQFSIQNVEQYAKGNIKIKIQDKYEATTGIHLKKIQPEPYFSEEYYTKNNKNKKRKLTKKEQIKFNQIYNSLDDDYRKKFNNIRNLGQLTLSDSQNKSSVLDNLHKILTVKRMDGVDSINILKDCLDILSNPSIITQRTEDLSGEYIDYAIERIYSEQKEKMTELWKKLEKTECDTTIQKNNTPSEKELKDFIKKRLKIEGKISENFLPLIHYASNGTCAAAGLEYDLATQNPAEFARIVEELTSPQNVASKNISIKDMDHLNELAFQTEIHNTKNEAINENNAVFYLEPDKDAIKLAQMQNTYKDKGERSIIDILFQSVIMNLGLDGTYSSITDQTQTGETGLDQIQVQYVREILLNCKTTDIQYKMYNEEKSQTTNIYNKEKIKEDLLNELSTGKNILIGYCKEDGSGGHEITIIGHIKNINGKGFFICQDSDDGQQKPVAINEDFILTKIFHANYKKEKEPEPPTYIAEPKKTIHTFPLMFYTTEPIKTIDGKTIFPWTKEYREYIQNLPISPANT